MPTQESPAGERQHVAFISLLATSAGGLNRRQRLDKAPLLYGRPVQMRNLCARQDRNSRTRPVRCPVPGRPLASPLSLRKALSLVSLGRTKRSGDDVAAGLRGTSLRPSYWCRALMLMLQAGMLGVFVSLDFFLFYVFWEVMLAPMYFLIGVWGGPRKLYAANQVLPLHPGWIGSAVARNSGFVFHLSRHCGAASGDRGAVRPWADV